MDLLVEREGIQFPFFPTVTVYRQGGQCLVEISLVRYCRELSKMSLCRFAHFFHFRVSRSDRRTNNKLAHSGICHTRGIHTARYHTGFSDLDLMICTAYKAVSLLIYAPIAPSEKGFGTIGCNANHINARRHGPPSTPYSYHVHSKPHVGGGHVHGQVRSVPLGSSLTLGTLRVIAGSSAVSLSFSLYFYGVGLVVGILVFFSRQPFDCFLSPPY